MNENYIFKIFGKENNTLSIDDLKEFFSTSQEESSVLEFKSGGVEIIDLYKEITAFLNTEGGLIIIGAPKEIQQTIGKNSLRVCAGSLTYSNFKNKDWLYQKISSNIVPSPTNIKIQEFLTERGNLFLIDVPQSLNPPHQCSSDGKYYIRLEREAKPAPHGIIQALFSKRRVPKLDAEIEVKRIDEDWDYISLNLFNSSQVPAEKVSYLVEIYNIKNIERKNKFRVINDSRFNRKISFSDHYKGVLVEYISIPIEFSIEHIDKDYIIVVGFWCRDVNFNIKFFRFSPVERRVVYEGNADSSPSLIEEIDKLKNY